MFEERAETSTKSPKSVSRASGAVWLFCRKSSWPPEQSGSEEVLTGSEETLSLSTGSSGCSKKSLRALYLSDEEEFVLGTNAIPDVDKKFGAVTEGIGIEDFEEGMGAIDDDIGTVGGCNGWSILKVFLVDTALSIGNVLDKVIGLSIGNVF